MKNGEEAGRHDMRLALRTRKALPAGLAALLLSATAASFLGSWSWMLDLLSHFRPQLAALGVVSMAVAVWASSRVAFALCLGLTFANAAPLVPYLAGKGLAGEAGITGEARLRVLTFNMHGRSTNPAALRRMVERENPDVILLTEVAEGFPLPDEKYPYRIVERTGSPFDVVLLSRWKPGNWSVDRSAASFLPVLTADLCHPEIAARCFTIIGLHAARPFGLGAKLQRDQLAIAAGKIQAASTGAVLLMGDLNLTPWSPVFHSFGATSGLEDSARARGLSTTWLSRFPLLGLPIDHILVNSGFLVVDNRLGEDLGSDHLPVIADLMFRSDQSVIPARAGRD